MSNTKTDYPAKWTVHGRNTCDEHAERLEKIMRSMGARTVRTPAPEGAQCDNCANEAKSRNAV